MKKKMKKLAALVLAGVMVFALAGCGSDAEKKGSKEESKGKVYKIGICNYVDDASLNQICDSIQDQLQQIGHKENVTFDIDYQNCNADSAVMNQIIADFVAKDVDLMIGVATPVVMAMQAATEDNKIPVVFAAVSDPIGCGVVESMEQPGANITGTSDALDTNAIMNLILAQNPETKKVGLLYDQGQDSSTSAIAQAKQFLESKNIEVVEKTGTTTNEVMLAADALVAEGVTAVFTPSDNTIMTAELSIYETFAKAGVLHYAGADSFALNGAFLGYGVDYVLLGVETANIVKDVLVDGADVAKTPVVTFDNGIATVNTDICSEVGLEYSDLEKKFAPLCTKVQSIKTAESFE